MENEQHEHMWTFWSWQTRTKVYTRRCLHCGDIEKQSAFYGVGKDGRPL